MESYSRNSIFVLKTESDQNYNASHCGNLHYGKYIESSVIRPLLYLQATTDGSQDMLLFCKKS